MTSAGKDPYLVLGVAPSVPDAELRRAYRRLVKLHHPDHNGGSAQSTERFAAIQAAYDEVARIRLRGHRAAPVFGASASTPPADAAAGSPTASEAELRLEALEREIKQRERERREREVRAAAARAAAKPAPRRPTREELGYYDSDDSFSAIFDDAVDEATDRLDRGDAKRRFTRRLTDLFGGG